MEANENQTLIDVGCALNGPETLENGKIPFVVVPEGYKVADLERLLPEPTRKRAAVQARDADGFCHYFTTHRDTARSSVYADTDEVAERFRVTAVLDDHGAQNAGWREHTCTLDRKTSVEWKRWTGKHKGSMTQAEFATFIEDNLADVISAEGMPTGSEMLQMALAFERTADKRLKSKVNLQSGGVRFEYVDDDNADTRTSMQVFSRFTIGIPVFEGASAAYQLEARLKYRDNSGKLTFWFELIRSDRAFRQAVADELAAITAATGTTIINGTYGAPK
jgi:uncharacterized protein YfdQ (DUF2303 family)